MRLFLLISLTMIAFAANSLLNRLALVDGDIGATTFGVVRLVSGAVSLSALVLFRGGRLRLGGPGRVWGVASLLVYMFGFSAAYLSLDAGLGALILFGLVQITMFAGALLHGERPTRARWIGSAVAFAGLVWLLWPAGVSAPSPLHAALMALAGIGWGVYSLVGRRAPDALQATAANFVLAAPAALALVLLVMPSELAGGATPRGWALAVLSGAVTSGMGYALWYSLLPQLQRSVAAVAQLSAPVIAVVGGTLLLGESPSLRLVLAAALVLGGVLLAVRAPERQPKPA